MKIDKLTLYSKEDLKELYEAKEIDLEFLCEYIEKTNKVYNMLADKYNLIQDLKEELEVMCLHDELGDVAKEKILTILEIK